MWQVLFVQKCDRRWLVEQRQMRLLEQRVSEGSQRGRSQQSRLDGDQWFLVVAVAQLFVALGRRALRLADRVRGGEERVDLGLRGQ